MADQKPAEKKAEEKKPEAGHSFEVSTGKGDEKVTKKFKTLLAIMVIPGINDDKPLTSLEVSKSKPAQERLIELGAIGSAIEEIA